MRRSRRTQEPKPGPSSRMDVDSDSDSDEPQMSQVSRSMKKVNVSQNGRGKTRSRQVASDSDEEIQPARNTQRLNGTHNKSRGRARQISESESDEEPQPSTSQASQANQKRKKNNASQSQRANQTSSQAGETFMGDDMPASQISPNTSLTEQEHDHHVANVVKYILSADSAKKVPIQKPNISKAVGCHNKNFKEIFKSAQDTLKDVFGYEMLEIEDEKKNDNGKNQVKTHKFILVNTIEGEDSHGNVDEDTATKYALLFLSLTHIFMSGGKCTEDSMKAFLKNLDIVTDHHVLHEQFGDAMEKVMIDFVKEKYIHLSEDKTELAWGIRAIKELKPRAVMEFISEMYGGRALNTWPEEYERLLQIEQGAGENRRPNGEHH